MAVYLIRHTTPDTQKGICYGITDMEVAEDLFPEELERIRSKLNGFIPRTIYSSPLKRCKKLANSLWDHPEIVYDNRLKELNFGKWEMKKWEEIPVSEIENWAEDYVNRSAPEGESYIELYERVLELWKQTPKNEDIAFVTHGGVIRAIVAHILGMPLDKTFLLNLPYGVVIRLDDSRFGDFKIRFC